MLQVVKRDGRTVEYDRSYITNAVRATVQATGYAEEVNLTKVVDLVESAILNDVQVTGNKTVSVERIQDLVEHVLIKEQYPITAKAYILYRQKRNVAREHQSELMRTYETLGTVDAEDSDMKRENANVNTDSSMGTMLKYGSESAKYYALAEVLPEEMAFHHRSGDFHIHDLDFLLLTLTCCQIDVGDMLASGFSTGHGYLRQPSGIGSAVAQACILLQANQNDQHGGQSIYALDYGLAPYVTKTYIEKLCDVIVNRYDVIRTKVKPLCKELKRMALTRELMDDCNDTSIINQFVDCVPEIKISLPNEWHKVKKLAMEATELATDQAFEAFVHNLNTMHSRAGAQVPFSSINFGTCTSIAGRMVIMSHLRALENGLGMGETSIFPVTIFKVKDGVNYKPGDPNYDCFEYACKVTAKRLFPNFAFIDAPFNLKFYKPGMPETEAAYMGCRTRVLANYHDPERQIVARRGNLSFTSINLPRLAIKAMKYAESCNANTEERIRYFYKLLDEMLAKTVEELDFRFDLVAKRKVRNYPILMQQGVWIDSEHLHIEDEIREVMKHGSLSVGFIGLAETLVALIGKHHGESEVAQHLGLEIIGYMRNYLTKLSEERHLNYTLLATPAEGLSGTFLKKDRKMFGIIAGVTDKDYYTNSNHVPVNYPITASEKIKIEAPYHALTDAGHICYVEMDGNMTDNPQAIMSVVRHMKEQGIGYGAINHPVDRDPVCGYVGVINDVCPRCGRREGEKMSQEMWERLQQGKYMNGAYDDSVVNR